MAIVWQVLNIADCRVAFQVVNVLQPSGAVAWLDVPLARVFDRVPADGRRPLAADRAQMEQLYARRRLTYAEAHVRIDGTQPVPDVVERLLEWVGF